MSDFVNRFRFTGGAQIPGYGPPVQGTQGMSHADMLAQQEEMARQYDLTKDPLAKEEAVRMAIGRAAVQPSQEELEAQEAMAREELTKDPNFMRMLIQQLMGGQ